MVMNNLLIEEQGMLKKCQEGTHGEMTPVKQTDAILPPQRMTKQVLGQIHASLIDHPVVSRNIILKTLK